MNGVINIWKEQGYSSFHVIYVLRKITGEQKIGHTGTLDPEVSGVLPVCIGKATKLVGQLTDTDKQYRCTLLLGKRTDTQDLTGTVLEEISGEEVRMRLKELAGNLPVFRKDHGNRETGIPDEQRKSMDRSSGIQQVICETLQGFCGEILQTPPMYSALKVDGMKLVNAARRGVEVSRSPRPVTIYSIDDITVSEDLQTIRFRVDCSKGTYMRTLCEDVGQKLGIPACMSSLERTCACGLDRTTAITLDQAAEYARAGVLEEHLIPADHFLMVYPAIVVRDEFVRKLVYGNLFGQKEILMIRDPSADESDPVSSDRPADRQIFRVYDQDGTFYALYQYDAGKECYRCVKMFLSETEAGTKQVLYRKLP